VHGYLSAKELLFANRFGCVVCDAQRPGQKRPRTPYFYEDVLVFSKLRGPLWAESRFCGQKVSSYFGVLVIGPRKFLLNTRWTIFVDLVSRYPKMTYEDFVELIKVILMVCVALLDHVCIRRYNTICDLLRSES